MACVTQVVQDQYESNVRAANIVSIFISLQNSYKNGLHIVFLFKFLLFPKNSRVRVGSELDKRKRARDSFRSSE